MSSNRCINAALLDMDELSGRGHNEGSTVVVPDDHTPAPASLNPYSCLPCRGRKKKCDRVYPCANCQKNGLDCIFVPRRVSTRQAPSVALQDRVRHLENLVSRMHRHMNPTVSQRLKVAHKIPLERIARLGDDCGRLTMDNGRSRYVASNSWASLEDDVDDLESLLQASQDDEMEHDFISTSHTGILGFGAAFHGLSQMHPPRNQIAKYWQFFTINCDPLIKVLHKPSVEPLILQASQQKGHIAKGLEALMMAVYYAATVSMSPDDCMQEMGGDRASLLKTFQFATEHALAKAGLLVTNEMITLQAFTIFLTSLRAHGNPRAISTLTALLVRLAQNAGIHHDGMHFKLPPFVVEIRRRLWWAICVLDSRACEDTGYEPASSIQGVDTCFPLNVNDADLRPEMKQFPQAKAGVTEMTFSIVRYESTRIFQSLQNASAGDTGLEGTEAVIKEEQSRISDLYLSSLDLGDAYSWYTWAISRIVYTKMWLVTFHPYMRKERSSQMNTGARDWLFGEATQALELWLRLNTEETTRQWRWLCETYVQWYALTFLLSELRYRTDGDYVTRAWEAIDASLHLGLVIHSTTCQAARADVYSRVDITEATCQIFKPLLKLLRRARAARASFLQVAASSLSAGILKSFEPTPSEPPLANASEGSDVEPEDGALNSYLAPIATIWPLETIEFCPSWLLEDLDLDNPALDIASLGHSTA